MWNLISSGLWYCGFIWGCLKGAWQVLLVLFHIGSHGDVLAHWDVHIPACCHAQRCPHSRLHHSGVVIAAFLSYGVHSYAHELPTNFLAGFLGTMLPSRISMILLLEVWTIDQQLWDRLGACQNHGFHSRNTNQQCIFTTHLPPDDSYTH